MKYLTNININIKRHRESDCMANDGQTKHKHSEEKWLNSATFSKIEYFQQHSIR